MRIPCAYMRGGTSKGLMFQRKDLPEDEKELHDLLLRFMGGSDPKQIDGMGGTVSSNNKIIIVWPSEKEDIDVEYTVGQAVVGQPVIDFSSNCGNMTSAVAPFAIDEGMVETEEPYTTLRMYNTNSDKIIEERVPVKDGKRVTEGDCIIAGVDGTSAELRLNFLDPSGAKTGKLLPTGKVRDVISIPDHGDIEVSVIDITNCFVFIHARDLGLKGNEMPGEIGKNTQVMELLEKIRGVVAEKVGIVDNWEDCAVKSAGSPKLVIVSEAQGYSNMKGEKVEAGEMDICVRIISVGQVHKATPISAATAMGGAAFLEGSVMRDYLGKLESEDGVLLGHPSGITPVFVDKTVEGGQMKLRGVSTTRTARRIMDGYIYS